MRRKLSSAHSPRNGLWTHRCCQQAYYAPTSHARPLPRNPCTYTWITTHLPTSEGWMAELAKARSMQPYIILYKTTLKLGVRNLPKVFTRQRPGGESNRVSTIRKSDGLPVSHRATIRCCNAVYMQVTWSV